MVNAGVAFLTLMLLSGIAHSGKSVLSALSDAHQSLSLFVSLFLSLSYLSSSLISLTRSSLLSVSVALSVSIIFSRSLSYYNIYCLSFLVCLRLPPCFLFVSPLVSLRFSPLFLSFPPSFFSSFLSLFLSSFTPSVALHSLSAFALFTLSILVSLSHPVSPLCLPHCFACHKLRIHFPLLYPVSFWRLFF